jgi:hypothetical protein
MSKSNIPVLKKRLVLKIKKGTLQYEIEKILLKATSVKFIMSIIDDDTFRARSCSNLNLF